MKKELLLLLAMTLLVCTAMAQIDFSMDSSNEKMVVDKWDAKKFVIMAISRKKTSAI